MFTGKTSGEEHPAAPVKIVFLGASVGKEWNLSEWRKRQQNSDYDFEMTAVYSFDKSEALEEILMRPKRKFHFNRSYIKGLFKPAPQKPKMIIIKECAAYFPGDLENYKTLIKKWIARCITSRVSPVLATVVPVTEEHSRGKPGRLQGILDYNDWLRTYAKEAGIGLLDLEAALRINGERRTLKPELTSGDGLHLNEKAYHILDKFLEENLSGLLKENFSRSNKGAWIPSS